MGRNIIAGILKTRASKRSANRLRDRANLLVDLFDAEWYLEQNPDVRASGRPAFEHYLSYGWSEGRWPNPIFDPKWYIENNPDVASAGLEPLGHYAEYGLQEGRQPSQLFIDKEYLAINPDVEAAGIFPALHYVKYGRREGRPTNRNVSEGGESHNARRFRGVGKNYCISQAASIYRKLAATTDIS